MTRAENHGHPAVFIDRDGTLIREREYLSEAEGVELLPGAAAALRGFQEDGYRIVVVTNQSGIARGLFDEASYRRVRAEVERQLDSEGVRLLGSYHCPHHPQFTGPCECRKPSPGLFRTAAREHGLDLSHSVFLGDRVRDVSPGLELDGLAILVRTGYGAAEESSAPTGAVVVDDLPAALTFVRRRETGR